MSRRGTGGPEAPPLPASSDDDPEAYAAIVAALKRKAAELRQRNLMSAVRLAQPAANGAGPLVDHFAELGRRFGHTLGRSPKNRTHSGLRVIDGGIKGGVVPAGVQPDGYPPPSFPKGAA